MTPFPPPPIPSGAIPQHFLEQKRTHFFFVYTQRDFLKSTLGRLPVPIVKDLAQRMVLVPKDSDVTEGEIVVKL